MILKEYQKFYLALQLKAGKKWLEDSLHVLSDEQCERAGGTRSGPEPRRTICWPRSPEKLSTELHER
jgi:hypothetical protein